MSKFEDEMMREIIESSQEIYLPNRYQKPFVDALQMCADIEVPTQVGRKLVQVSEGRTFRWMRGRDIPRIIALVDKARPDANAIGLTGSDWCQEYIVEKTNRQVSWYDMGSVKPMGRLAIISPPGVDSEILQARLRSGDTVPVVTVYPNIAEIYVPKILYPGFKTSPCVVVNGGVEGVADALNMPGLDMVSKGDTVRENGFTIIENLQEVYPAMVTGERNGVK